MKGQEEITARVYWGVLVIETKYPDSGTGTLRVLALGHTIHQRLVDAIKNGDGQAISQMLADLGQPLTDEEVRAILAIGNDQGC